MSFCRTIQKRFNPRLEDHGLWFIVFYTSSSREHLLLLEKKYNPTKEIAEKFANIQLISLFKDFPNG